MTLIFDNFPGTCTTFDIPENCEKYDILLQVVCGNGAILVILAVDNQKSTFLTHFVIWLKCDPNQLWHENDMGNVILGGEMVEFGSPGAEILPFEMFLQFPWEILLTKVTLKDAILDLICGWSVRKQLFSNSALMLLLLCSHFCLESDQFHVSSEDPMFLLVGNCCRTQVQYCFLFASSK